MIADTPVHATIVHDSIHSGGLMKMLESLGLQNIKVRFIPAKMAFEYYLTGRKMNIELLEL